MSNWFVFYVQTGEEHKACEFLNKLFDKDDSVAFVPQVEIVFKNSHSIRKELRPMFPGYIFTDSILEERLFVNLAYKYARFSKCIFYFNYCESNSQNSEPKHLIYSNLRLDSITIMVYYC